MAYLGNTPSQQAFAPAVDYFNGNASTVAFTLSRPVASVAQVQVTIENVPQNPSSSFTVSGSTITFTSAPPSGTSNIYVQYTSPITQVIAPGQGTVNTTQLGSITTIPNGAATLTLPTTTDTLVGKATTDTLTNKTLTSPTLTTPALGAATATSLTVSGAVLVTSVAGLGYGTGSGGTVTQATSKSTGVTLNKPSGTITMVNTLLAANTNVSFILTNSIIATGDLVLVNINDSASLNAYQACAENSRGGSVYIMLRNTTGASLAEAVVLSFAIIKAVSA